MHIHKDKAGNLTAVEDLKDSHLWNIIKYIERKAKKGVYVFDGGGHDSEDIWYYEDTIYGEEALFVLDYEQYTQEWLKRFISLSPRSRRR